ncbi:uncharacterized protein LOC132310117 [Cornus florida]|uniref:uncharacterized protein LOC132310117 n=1 Tax=Cornus florida TaxID=4283 RepID=UPI00289DCBC8|nr:uncharacterized protein LOC132310117 [Cornus florida]
MAPTNRKRVMANTTDINNDELQSMPDDGQCSATSVKRRGPSTNKALEDVLDKNKRQPLEVTFKEGHLQPVGKNAKLWKAEIGVETRRFPAIYPRYDKIPPENKDVVYYRLKVILSFVQNYSHSNLFC